jgi:hypothetical protein
MEMLGRYISRYTTFHLAKNPLIGEDMKQIRQITRSSTTWLKLCKFSLIKNQLICQFIRSLIYCSLKRLIWHYSLRVVLGILRKLHNWGSENEFELIIQK